MATHLLTFRLTGIHACAIPCHPKLDPNRRKSTSSSSTTNWWSPLFGLSSDPDYIDSDNKTKAKEKREGESEQKPARSKFSLGCFSEEKARELRMMTTNSSSFHDVMYHRRSLLDWPLISRIAAVYKSRASQRNI